MKSFYLVLINNVIASVTNNFIWFALTFWAFLETNSVLATSIVSGVYLTVTALSGFWLGSIVDHHKKKDVMILSSIVSLIFFTLGLLFFYSNTETVFTSVKNIQIWVFILLLLLGVIAGNLRNIALPTIVTLLIPEDSRDKANGLVGSTVGISFALTSVGSGLILAYGGMSAVLQIAIVITVLAIIHMLFVQIPEKKVLHQEGGNQKVDIKGTIKVVLAVPGLLALIFFTTFNNFLGGIFMALMDAYGLTLVSVQVWGVIFGFLSFGFILGGLIIAKKGLGKNPLKTMFISMTIMWVVSIFFTIQASLILLVIGMAVWITLSPFIEASEQTIIQKVVPMERQGRVFGFATSIEQAASPLTAFIIGPIAQFIFIPFMTSGLGVELIGDWYGTGLGRGIALVFSLTGIIGLIATIVAIKSKSYKLLSKSYSTK